MILYDSPKPTPNPRKVRIFAAEKGMAIPTRSISVVKGEQKSAEYLAVNPLGQVPALALDDGQVITESVSICRYLEAMQPEPALFGTTALEIATIDMWVRRVEFVLSDPMRTYWIHFHPYTAQVVPNRFPDYGETGGPRTLAAMAVFDKALADSEFLAGSSFSMADISLLTAIDFAAFIGLNMPAECRHLQRWHKQVSARPSADA